MGQLWRSWGGVLTLWAAALPVAALVGIALNRWRRLRGVPPGPARWRSVAEVGMVAGTAPWIWMTLTPRPGPRLVHLVPLTDLADQVRSMSPTEVAVQTVGNLLVFAALGFFAPIRFPALAGVGRLLLLGAAASTVIEVLQFLLVAGRVSSADDVLINAAGAGLAGLLSRRWWSAGAPRPLVPIPAAATTRR